MQGIPILPYTFIIVFLVLHFVSAYFLSPSLNYKLHDGAGASVCPIIDI